MKTQGIDFLNERKHAIENYLSTSFIDLSFPETLRSAMMYSLMAGGKRLRPVLMLTTANSLGADVNNMMPVAAAIEMIHTYSLIHDDLPAMDNDDYRRGKLTNHKVYGEAMAILAGDALLTKAFELMTTASIDNNLSPQSVLITIQEIAKAAGAVGMVGGQVADMEAEALTPTIDQLRYIHEHKTGDLLTVSVRAGAILCNASDQQLTALTTYAKNIGLAFQIQDDILDIIGDENKLGKPIGSDMRKNKMTYPALKGIESCFTEVDALFEEATEVIKNQGIRTDELHAIINYLRYREH